MKFYRVDFEPLGRHASCQDEASILEAARQAGVSIASICGGEGTCGRCKVEAMGPLSPLTAQEEEHLSAEEIAAGYRLACQARVLGNVMVYLPPESLSTIQRLQVEGRELHVTPEPPVRAYPVQVPPASLGDLRADAARLRDALREQHGLPDAAIDMAVLRELPTRLREQGWRGTAFVRNTGRHNEIVYFGPWEATPIGLAVDLGTTKIAAYLVELSAGRTLAAGGVMNPQIAFGEDVMARIAYAMRGEEEAQELQQAAAAAINDLAAKLCREVGQSRDEIVEAVVVGNTAMHHLFLGLPVGQLGTAPYVPSESAPLDVKAKELGLRFAPGAYVHLLPNIAGFVGADHVAMLLATRMPDMEEVVLGLDIGTNTEIALRAKGRLITCSTASGPAFEGAHIKDGMRAAEGAIECVCMGEGEILYQTIGGLAPVGLCGSGVLDAVATLRKAGILSRTGRMMPHPRVREGDDGIEFVLVEKGESGHGRDIVITGKDVEAIQLAKGAIRAGIEILMVEAGIKPHEVERVILAGAFGTYLNVDSALSIGMLPSVPKGRVKQVGNAAGMGAKMALVSLRERRRAWDISRRVEYLELTALSHFADFFARAMYLE